MRPEVQSLTGDDEAGSPKAFAFLGGRWALLLGAISLLALAGDIAARWQETASSPNGPEIVIQQPIPAEPFPAVPRFDTTAPDPGDTPP